MAGSLSRRGWTQLEDFLESRLRVKYGEALADVSKETTYESLKSQSRFAAWKWGLV